MYQGMQLRSQHVIHARARICCPHVQNDARDVNKTPRDEEHAVDRCDHTTLNSLVHGTTTPKLDHCPPIEWWFPTSLP